MHRHAKKHNARSRTLYCSVIGCEYATEKAFYRRDKLLSHERTVHQIENNFPLGVMELNVVNSDYTLSAGILNINNVILAGNTTWNGQEFLPNLPGGVNSLESLSIPTDAIPVSLPFSGQDSLYPSLPAENSHEEFLSVPDDAIPVNLPLPGAEPESPEIVMLSAETTAVNPSGSSSTFPESEPM
jgi:hypothetical protein